jgi:drug/metabolite transporter (DMT)-like permease
MKKEKILTNTGVVCGLALICCALWGSAFPCVKLGYAMFRIPAAAAASQILFAGMRFSLAGLLVLVLGSLLQKRPLIPKNLRTLGRAGKLSVFQTILQYIFFYIGLANTTGVKASIIEGANVFIAILVASLIFHMEKFTVPKIIGCAAGFAGVVIVNLNGAGLDFHMTFRGEGLILLSTVAYSFSSVLMKRYSREEDPVTLSGWQFFFGGLFMMAVGFLCGGKIGPVQGGGGPMLLYLALISAVAYTLWGILLQYNPVSRVAVFGFMNPVLGVVFSAWLLQEGEQAFGWRSLAALILICIGIVLVNRAQNPGKINKMAEKK